MRIVDLTTFLALPPGTVFAKYAPCHFGELSIKADNFGDYGDFWYQDIIPWFEGANDTGDWTDTLTAMEAGASSPPLDYNIVSRDGLHEKGQLYAVFERHDVEALIGRLNQCLADGYAKDPTP